MQDVECKKKPAASLRSLERVVRRVELGVWGTGPDCPPAGERWALPPGKAERSWRRTEKANRDYEANGNRLAIETNGNQRAARTQSREEERLTNPSSATEAGDARCGIHKRADRQPPFAGARG